MYYQTSIRTRHKYGTLDRPVTFLKLLFNNNYHTKTEGND